MIGPRIYRLMHAEAQRRGLPARFQTDLTRHDALWCMQHATGARWEPFVWVLRDSGTHISRDQKHLRAVLECFSDIRAVFKCSPGLFGDSQPTMHEYGPLAALGALS